MKILRQDETVMVILELESLGDLTKLVVWRKSFAQADQTTIG